MPDRLIIRGLEAACRIGTTEQEQTTPQAIWIDIELAIDAAKAARRDDVIDAVDYASLTNTVKALAEATTYRLLETLAEEIAALILKQFLVPQVMVRITKRALPGIESAAVEIVRPA